MISMNFHRLERAVKGFANHRRIEMMRLLKSNPELSVDEIATCLKINFKTASEHIRRLAISGLVLKRSDGKSIRHKLTMRAENVLKFLRMLE